MAVLDIRPHSHRVSVFAAAGLSLLAVVAFAAGVTRQLAPQGPSPFPPPQEASLRIEVANGMAPPAEPPRRSPRAVAPDEAAETAQPPPGVDVSAVVADPPSPPPADVAAPPEPPPAPAPAEDPPTP